MFNPIRTRRTAEEVTRQVRALLARGTLQPGDRLPAERVLSRDLGVSRSALREALRGLEMSGLIELRKGKTGGAFITRGDPAVVASGMADLLRLGNISFEHVTEARLWIEEMIVRAACERATAEDLQALERNAAEAERLYREGRLLEKALKNIEFHDLLAHATRNPVMAIVARTMNDVMRAFIERLGADPSRAVIGSREKLIGAIKAGRTRAAITENAKALRAIHKFYATASKRKAA